MFNPHASLTNEFVQHPQAPMSLTETRLFHTALRCLHRLTNADAAALPYFIEVKQLNVSGAVAYASLADAIESLKARRWFGEPLFAELNHIKKEGIEFRFNPALLPHLLHSDAWYTTLNLADVEAKGLRNPNAYRLLWVLRSYYRPKATVKKKYLTIAELESLFFAGNSPFAGSYSKLKGWVNAAVASLAAAGIHCTATTKKRGLIAKGITFILPELTLQKAKGKVRQLVLDAIDSVKETVKETVKEVAVPLAVAATVAVAASAPTEAAAEPVTPTPPPTTIRAAGPLSGLIQRVVGHERTATAPTPPPVPANTYVVSGQPDPLREKLRKSHAKLLGFGLTTHQAAKVCRAVLDNPTRYEKGFFKAVFLVDCDKHSVTADKLAGFAVNKLKSEMGFTF